MKKGLFVFVCLIVILTISLIGCISTETLNGSLEKAAKKENATKQEDASNEIKLTLSNYDYYLTIFKDVTSSDTYAGGTVRIVFYKVRVTGAISGLYQDCALYYKVGADGEESEVKLNAAGNAEFSYSSSNGKELTFVRVKGKIVR